jgi:TolB-like protein/class 3 adenylate cyclase/Tfp pilus assembly protein PilF
VTREQRRLAAIVAADVVGYSRLMGRDESGTVARLRQNRAERLDPILARYGGRLVKLTGDGALVEFGSAVDALSATIAFQQAMVEANRDQPADTSLVFRMGLHLGDLIVDGDDLYGDGVNIAARLEAEAPAGGIVISRTVHEAVAGRLKATFDDLGSLALKNIERPVQAFSVKWEPSDWQLPVTIEATAAPVTASLAPLPLPDKPSIAVLPFQNMSGDPEQEYFADGMVEDIITALSRQKSLFVIARNSTFTYKGKAVDIKHVGRDLGVRYVLEGSVRKAGNRVRITGQLIDALSGAHIWADRFERTLEDVFELQDEVTSRVVSALSPALEQAEIALSRRKPTESLKAYDFYLRGRMCRLKLTKEGLLEAIDFFGKAIELDPEFAQGWAETASCYALLRGNYWSADLARETAEAERFARCALALDKTDARVLAHAGYTLAHPVGHIDEGTALLDLAIEFNPNYLDAWSGRGWTSLMLGEVDAFKYFERALRLNPLDRVVFQVEAGMANGHFLACHYDDAITWATKSLQRMPTYAPSLIALVLSHAMAGNTDEAKRLWNSRPETLRNLRPSRLNEWWPAKPEVLKRYAAAFRLIGVAE